MAGRVGNGLAELHEEAAAAEPLPEELEPEVAAGVREIVLGRNVHASCFAVKEPDADDEDTGEREATMAAVLARYRRSLTERTKHHLGYPYNLDFDYGALAQLQHFSINNLGDPFIESNYGVHSRQFEVGVLDWFARLWDLEKDEYWGYITNCGTEGNLHGILVGREVFPDGILYASRESHYSVFKAARMYRMDCVKVDTLVSGEIDCADFGRKLFENKDKPAIINVNIGTTVKGAVDDLDLVIETLEKLGFENRFYIHCDGALFGLMMPFVKLAPRVSFKKPIGSVSVSGHKFVGCPMPCGVQITRLKHINALASNVEYLASRDATIMGSRNGHAPIFLWYTLNRKGYRSFQKEVQKCLRNAHYLKGRLMDAGISAMLNELSSTVVFERPKDEEFVRRWQLACEGNISHVVVMPSVTISKLDSFLNELVEKRATWYLEGICQSPCIAGDVGQENCLCTLHKMILKERLGQIPRVNMYSRRTLLHTPFPGQPSGPSQPVAGTTATGSSFDANVVMILALLLCALICALGINSIARCALRCSSRVVVDAEQNHVTRLAKGGLRRKALRAMPILVYSAGLKLNTACSMCTICLSDFEAGEHVKVLPKCNHGFHVRCIDRWLLARSTCPTCRQCLFGEPQKTSGCSEVSQADPARVQSVLVPLRPEGLITTYDF